MKALLTSARLAGTFIVLICASACSEQSAEPAVLGASPVTDVPVGPIPGDGTDDATSNENPFAQSLAALDEGRRFFLAYNCAGCHGDHGGGGMGPSLRDEAWLYGAAPGQVANSIAEGRANGMPSWGRMLTDAQIWQLTAYIKSLRTPDEPARPGE